MNPVHELVRGSRLVHGSWFTDSGRGLVGSRFTVRPTLPRLVRSRFAVRPFVLPRFEFRFRVHGRFEGEPLNQFMNQAYFHTSYTPTQFANHSSRTTTVGEPRPRNSNQAAKAGTKWREFLEGSSTR